MPIKPRCTCNINKNNRIILAQYRLQFVFHLFKWQTKYTVTNKQCTQAQYDLKSTTVKQQENVPSGVHQQQTWLLQRYAHCSHWSFAVRPQLQFAVSKKNKKDGYCQWNVRQFLHMLAMYALGTISVNVTSTYMDGKRIQCLSNASQHVPIYLNCFPVIQPVSSKVRHLSLPSVCPWDNHGKCYMGGNRIQC